MTILVGMDDTIGLFDVTKPPPADGGRDQRRGHLL